MKSAHHTTHKNVGFGCSTNAKVILINIVSNELMTSSARDASSLQNTKNDGNMELRILQFKENIFHFPIWHALLLLVENERRKFNQLSVTSCSLNEISHLQRWQAVSFWHFPPNFQKLPAWKDSELCHSKESFHAGNFWKLGGKCQKETTCHRCKWEISFSEHDVTESWLNLRLSFSTSKSKACQIGKWKMFSWNCKIRVSIFPSFIGVLEAYMMRLWLMKSSAQYWLCWWGWLLHLSNSQIQRFCQLCDVYFSLNVSPFFSSVCFYRMLLWV